MSNNIDINSAMNGIDSDIVSVTQAIVNSHCIVCGTAFRVARAGKLYCTPRCKQFGYNHKDEIKGFLSTKHRSINSESLVFYIDDYISFTRTLGLMKQYIELSDKRASWESLEKEIALKNKCGLEASEFTWSRFISRKLTDQEENGLYEAESVLDDRLIGLKPKELSIEQWSFIKSLHRDIDEISFIEIVSSLSKEFISHLTLDRTERDNEFVLIRNKFTNHCNLVASGKIKFQKK